MKFRSLTGWNGARSTLSEITVNGLIMSQSKIMDLMRNLDKESK